LYHLYFDSNHSLSFSINRERVFIVGIKKSLKKKFEWPKKKKMESLKKYVDWKDTRKDVLTDNYKKRLIYVNPNSYFIDLGFQTDFYPNGDKYCPCLITSPNLFNFKLMRKANIQEYLKLQGFPISFKQVVSDNQLKKQIGNSMSVNVLKELFKCIKVENF
jgi:DNA (cytosine-5)-methyltransferase 1